MTKIIITLMGTVLCVSAGWHPLKPMTDYHGEDFHLKPSVAYVELRRSDTVLLKEYKTKVKRAFIMSRKSLDSYGVKTAKAFRHIPMSSKKRYKLLSGGYGFSSWYYNGFMLDTHGKIWRLETVKDLIDMVAPIDTPAEAKLVLWAHKHAEGFTTDDEGYRAKYRKSGQNYIIEEHYAVDDTIYGECGVYTYRSTVTRSGRITHRKRISKRPVKDCGTSD